MKRVSEKIATESKEGSNAFEISNLSFIVIIETRSLTIFKLLLF